MKKKISNQFAINYLIVFILSILAAVFALLLMSFAGDVLSKTLTKNIYPAAELMRDDYAQIDAGPVVASGGGVQIVSENYAVVRSDGLDTIGSAQLTPGEFTEFLMQSRSVGMPYHYDIQYNEAGRFWLIVTFPTSIRFGLDFAVNREYISQDMQNVAGAIVAIVIFYLLLLGVFALIFSRMTAVRITRPLRKLADGTARLREGDYTTRVDLQLKNEFAELQETFNAMAERIETETARRKAAEDERRRLVLDLSHDLKNPLAGAAGYAELLLNKHDTLSERERNDALRAVYDNSLRAGSLLTSLFELSKLDSPDFKLSLQETDICEYLRETCANLLPSLDSAGFKYEFDIPDSPIFILLDTAQLNRVFYNLTDNAVRYNPPGTEILVGLTITPGGVEILFKDNGAGIQDDKARDIFKPFVRADDARNSQTGGSGLGLSIVQKLVQGHGGTITLETGAGLGCTFKIILPNI